MAVIRSKEPAVGPVALQPDGGGRARPAVPDGSEHTSLDADVEALRQRIRSSGTPLGVHTAPLATLPYPSALALGEVPRSPATWVTLTARMLVIQWHEGDTLRTLLWEPRDHERSAPLPEPYLTRRRPSVRPAVHGTVPGHLRALGIAPEDVDYVALSSLQGHDLRRLLGTRGPATDLGSPERAVDGWLPSARLLIARAEWEALDHLDPRQRPWYQTATFTALDTERVLPLDGDVLVGPGIALVATPGRTTGHTSLVLHTSRGLWVGSSNGVAADSWAPMASRMPGVRPWAVAWDREVLPHANDAVSASAQYHAMLIERGVADTAPGAPFPQCLPTTELTRHRLSPGLAPTHVHGRIAHGSVRGTPVPVSGSA